MKFDVTLDAIGPDLSMWPLLPPCRSPQVSLNYRTCNTHRVLDGWKYQVLVTGDR